MPDAVIDLIERLPYGAENGTIERIAPAGAAQFGEHRRYPCRPDSRARAKVIGFAMVAELLRKESVDIGGSVRDGFWPPDVEFVAKAGRD